MIVLKSMHWSYAFSYGPDNFIQFDASPLLQLIGKNGHGKSSIALILEEVLFNTNSKKIKKADVLNRYTSAKSYNITLDFNKDNDDYTIVTTRGVTQTVKLWKNKTDISAHTATATYKLIEEILGFDHKTFTQIVYQSSAYSLEFLTATDTNRKKFLIDLLNLSIYTQYADLFKSSAKELASEVDSVNTKLSTVSGWLAKFGAQDLTKKPLLDMPTPLGNEMSLIAQLGEQLANIDVNNKRISQNNKYIEILNSIELKATIAGPTNTMALEMDLAVLQAQLVVLDARIKGNSNLFDKCKSCGQPIDNSHKLQDVENAKVERSILVPKISILQNELKTQNEIITESIKIAAAHQEWEKYHTLINASLPTKLYDRDDLNLRKNNLEQVVKEYNHQVNTINRANVEIVAHNTKIDVILQQMETMQVDFARYTEELGKLSKRLTNLQLLVKTFGTSGLVAYKIECLVKDLENLTNEYLVDMSDGRFQITFKMNSSDKLNVIITDNGFDIDIQALSNGEKARVNVATLLAIRKLMQSLSNSRINLLILDETVESLDADGKDKLVEVLLAEEYLNTVLVSHSFTHPLINKIGIVKENNISSIE